LWLPAKYKLDMPKLLAAAQMVESGESCKKLVRGELLQSSSPQLVFRILCRNEQNQTFVTLVDGNSLELVNLSGETRLEQHQRHIAQYWRKCRDSLQHETEAMINTRWPETRLLQPSILEDERILFEVKFTAENLAGDTLYYLGTCDYAGLSDLTINIKPRL
jgi:hypothetical protein